MGRPAVKKHLIENAAVELFATKGLTGTSVRDIAQKAGVAEGALYRHWEGKDDLGFEIFTRYLGQLTADLEKHLINVVGDMPTRLGESVSFMYNLYKAGPTRVAFMLLTENGFPQEKAIAARTEPFDRIVQFIRYEMHRGQVRQGDPVVMAAMVIGVIIRPLISHWYGRIVRDPLELINEVTDSIVAMIGSPDILDKYQLRSNNS